MYMFVFLLFCQVVGSKTVISSFSTQNNAEPSRNYIKKQVLDPKRAKFDQNSDFGHVRTYTWLHKWRWGNPHGGSGGTLEGGAQSQPFKRLYKNPLRIPQGIGYLEVYIPYIFHIWFLNMFHIFSLVCFLIYGVKSRSWHDRSQSLGSISHTSDPKLVIWGNF